MLHVAIIGCGYLPNPAVRGGAVETLVDSLVEQNEESRQARLHVMSCYDPDAVAASKKFTESDYSYIKFPFYVRTLDKVIYHLAKDVLRKTNSVSYRYILQRLFFIRECGKILDKGEFDLVVLENHATLLRALKVGRNRERYRGKVIYHMHNEVRDTYGCSAELGECRFIAGVSDYVNRVISSSNPDIVKPEQLRVLRNRVDSSVFERTRSDGSRWRAWERLGIADGEKMVLFTGRICPEKGVRELLQAFEKAALPKTRLVVAGGYFFGSNLKTEYEENVRALAATLGDRVIFTGYVNHDLIPELYAACDIVAVPSVWEDPAPLAVVEAIEAGKRLVTTDSGGIPEYAQYGKAIVVKRGEDMVEEFALALENAVNDCDGVNVPAGWNREGYYEDFVSLLEETRR